MSPEAPLWWSQLSVAALLGTDRRPTALGAKSPSGLGTGTEPAKAEVFGAVGATGAARPARGVGVAGGAGGAGAGVAGGAGAGGAGVAGGVGDAVAADGAERAGGGALDLPGGLAVAVGRLSGDPAGVLLDAAGLAVTYRRAGVLPERVAVMPEPAPGEVFAAPSRRAAGLLARVLGTNLELVRFWCETAATRNRLAPQGQLPALLDLAVRHPTLRAAVVGVLGHRGRWLAAMQLSWAGAVAAGEREWAAARAEPPGAPSDAVVQLLDHQQRRKLLASLPAGDVHLVAQQLSALSGPWPDKVASDVLTWLKARMPELPQLASRPLLSLIAQRFPLDDGSIAELAAGYPDAGWRVRLAFVARDLTTRRDIDEALR